MKTFLLSKVTKTDSGCWEWQGPKDHSRYGMFSHQGIKDRTHRIAWTLFNGSIPNQMHVLHKCDNPSCCNPEHLFLGTHQDNMRDRNVKGRNPLGVNSSSAKLNDEKVIEIKRRLSIGSRVGVLASTYGVDKNTIMAIRDGETWKHIKEPRP